VNSRNDSDTAVIRDLAQMRGSFDLLLRAQQFGRTGYVISDVHQDRVYWSDSLFAQRKVERREYFTREEALAFIHPDDLEGFLQARDRALAEHRDFELEMRVVCGDGSIIWEQGLAQPLFDAAGNYSGLLTVVRDITADKDVAASLMEQEATYRTLFNGIGDSIFLMLDGRFLDCNDAALRMFRCTREQMIGDRPARFSPLRQPDGRPSNTAASEKIAGALRGERQFFEWRHMRQDGSEFDAEVTLTRVEAAGQPYFFGVVRDISERKQAEAALQASHDKFAGAFNASTDAMLVIAPAPIAGQGRILDANEAAKKVFGLPREALIGKTIAETGIVIAPEDLAELRRRLESNDVRDVAIALRRNDGSDAHVEITGSQFNSSGSTLAIVTIRDVTARMAAEEQLRQSQKLQAIGKLTGGVAHDFNNLLAVISGNLELANEALAGGNEDVRRLLDPARRAAERGSTLTRSLLSFARQQPLSPQVTDLSALARDTTELLRRTLPPNIDIEFAGGAGLWSCEVDSGQLQNALLNLVVNSRDAMPDGGRLTIATANIDIGKDDADAHADLLPGQYVTLAVSDTGLGMPRDVLERVFEPFFTTKAVGEGTGLGLSMVYGFARQSGGHVAISSEVGRGTTVRLYLPRWTGAAQNPPPLQTAGTVLAETVLLVEDDEDMRLIAGTMLRSLGYTVLEAPNGAKALDVAAKHSDIALLVTDVVLAGSMNGRRLAQEMANRRPGIKVLYMSGYTQDAIVNQGRLDPGVHFIQKPFRKADLAAKAREALDAGPPLSSP
jgi:PAS domain S-box-containing protein